MEENHAQPAKPETAEAAPVVMPPSRIELVTQLVIERFLSQASKPLVKSVVEWLQSLGGGDQPSPQPLHRLQLRHELLPLVTRCMLRVALPGVPEEERVRLADIVVSAAHVRAEMQRATPGEKAVLDAKLAELMRDYAALSLKLVKTTRDSKVAPVRSAGAFGATLAVFELQSFLAVLVPIVKWVTAALSLDDCLSALRRSLAPVVITGALRAALAHLKVSDPDAEKILLERPRARQLAYLITATVAPSVLRCCEIRARTYAPPEIVKRPGIGEVEMRVVKRARPAPAADPVAVCVKSEA